MTSNFDSRMNERIDSLRVEVGCLRKKLDSSLKHLEYLVDENRH